MAAIGASISPIGLKLARREIDSFTTAFLCASLALILQTIGLAASGRFDLGRLRRQGILPRLVAFLFFLQAVPLCIWAFAVADMTGVVSILLKRTQPIVILVLGAILMRRRVRLFEWLFTAVALVGIYLLVSAAGTGSLEGLRLRGVVFGSLSVLLWALQFLYLKKVAGHVDAFHLSWLAMAVIVVVTLVPAWMSGISKVVAMSSAGWGGVVLSGVGGFSLAVVCLYYALLAIDPWKMSLIMLTGPVFGTLAAVAFLGEKVYGMQIVGALIIVASVGAVVFGQRSGASGGAGRSGSSRE